LSEKLLKDVLARCARAGAKQADAVLVLAEAIETRVRGEEIDFVKQSKERTLGIRAMVQGADGLSTAVTSTSDLSPETALKLAEETVALAQATAPDPFAGLPEGDFAGDAPDLSLLDDADRSVSVDQHIETARAAESAARAVDERIQNSEGSESSAEFLQIHYGNSAGFFGGYESASHGLFSMPIARSGDAMQTDYWSSVARTRAGLESPDDVGRRAAERALRRLGAVRAPTSEVPVVFDPLTARSLLSHVASCITGGSVYRKTSFLADKLGREIANSRLTIIDDGRRPGGLGTRPFDGEGLATRRTTVVEEGQLKSFLLDSYSARKLALEATGSASRSPGGRPGAAPTNLWIEAGETSQEAMIASTERGLFVTSLFGHGFNPTTGDFSRGAAGIWIEGGELSHPVEEITIAGNLAEMLMRVDAVGDDLLWQSSIAAPSLRISQMTVAGDSTS